MTEKLKILHLEDLPTDAELVARELKKSGLLFEILVVDNEKDFIQSLAEFSPHIVLSDHSLPTFSSFGALKVLHERGVEIPFILITSTTSEEIAVSVMKAGAWDYILKDRLQRLPTALLSALEKYTTEKQKREYQEEIQNNEKRYRGLVENIEDIIILVDENYSVTYRSLNYERITGWKPEQQSNLVNFDLIHPEDQKLMRNLAILASANPGKPIAIAFRLTHQTGRYLWMEGIVNNLLTDESIKSIIFTMRDVTEKRRAERELVATHERLLFHIENSPLGFVEWDNQFKMKHWSPRAEEIFGWTTQEYQDLQDGGHTAVYPEDYQFAFEKAQELLQGGVTRNHFQHRANTKSGKVIWVEWFNSVLKNSTGEAMTIMSLVSDITEKKLADENLEAKEKRFRALIENISDGIVVSNADHELLYQSPSVERILGYSEKERLNHSLKSYIHPDYEKEYNGLYSDILKNPETPHPFELPFMHKNGNYVWLEGIATNLLNDSSIQGVVVNYRDVTQRKMLNDILREYNDRHEIVSKATNDAIWDWDIERDYEIWNHGTETIFGYNEHEVNSSREWWKDRLHLMDFERVNEELAESFKHGAENWTSQYQYLCADGTYKHVLDRAFIVYKEGKPVRMIGAIQDITERVSNEQKLRSLNDQYEIVLNTTGDAVWEWNLLHNTVTWGAGLFKLFGYPIKGPIVDNFWLEKIHEDDRSRVENSIYKVIANGEQFKWEDEYRFKKSDDTYAFVHGRGTMIRNDEGQAIRMVGSMQDITDRKLAIDEIEKLSLVASKTDNIVIITDAEEKIEWVNESFVKLTGYTLNEAIGLTPRILQGPETDPHTVSRIRNRLNANQPVIEEILNYSKDGNKYWLRMNINPVFNNMGEVTKFIAVETDITRQKEYEGNIVSIAHELTELIEHANVPIFGVDRSGSINEWNKTAASISGYSKNEALGKKWTSFTTPSVHKKAKQIIEKTFSGKPSGNFELPFVSKNGKQHTLLISVSARRDRDRNIVGALCVGQDLTEVIQYRQGLEALVQERTHELNEALKKEKELVEMKSKFVSIASHEFRTPLSTISLATGFIRKYQQQLAKEDIDKKLDNIEKQVNQMVYLLDDVLLVGKADAGKILVNRSEIDIETFERLAVEVIESKKTKHWLHFSDNCDVTAVFTDEKLVRNIIINLITNAVKFSPDTSKIEMNIHCDLQKLIITVTDHGIGIPEKDIKDLFTSFYRGSNVGTIEGTGLGLSIVKKAVDLLRGTIKLKSKIGKGSEFKVTLPLDYA